MSSREPPTPGDPLGKARTDRTLVLRFMGRLWALDRWLHSASKRMETTYGMTAPQLLVVGFVGRSPGISAGALAETLNIHPSTLTGILRHLELRGVLRRRRDPKDARRALLGLTPNGRHVDALRSGTVEDAIGRVLERMPTDIPAAERILAALTSELEVDLGKGNATDPDG